MLYHIDCSPPISSAHSPLPDGGRWEQQRECGRSDSWVGGGDHGEAGDRGEAGAGGAEDRPAGGAHQLWWRRSSKWTHVTKVLQLVAPGLNK